MIKPIGLVAGHYESRSLEETIPVLEHFLAFEVVQKLPGAATVKHPNTDWLLILHEAGPNAQDKPRFNHYGVRVATNEEVDRAYEYLQSKKKEFGLKVDRTRDNHLAHSVHFVEPGGNWWEIESYEEAVKEGLGANVAVPWKVPLSEDAFPGREYVPQALTHGTIGCASLESSNRFYREVLGLDVVFPFPDVTPRYIKHPSTPWYIVGLEIPEESRKPTQLSQRFTVAVESVDAVREAHKWLREVGQELGVTDLAEVNEQSGSASFLLSDLNRNWWEITSPIV